MHNWDGLHPSSDASIFHKGQLGRGKRGQGRNPARPRGTDHPSSLLAVEMFSCSPAAALHPRLVRTTQGICSALGGALPHRAVWERDPKCSPLPFSAETPSLHFDIKKPQTEAFRELNQQRKQAISKHTLNFFLFSTSSFRQAS